MTISFIISILPIIPTRELFLKYCQTNYEIEKISFLGGISLVKIILFFIFEELEENIWQNSTKS